MSCVLGCCTNTAAIYDRCESRKVLELDDVESIAWGRKLDQGSEANVAVGRNGQCCTGLDQIRTWRHELVVWRCGVQVWSGPITRITYGRNGTVF